MIIGHVLQLGDVPDGANCRPDSHLYRYPGNTCITSLYEVSTMPLNWSKRRFHRQWKCRGSCGREAPVVIETYDGAAKADSSMIFLMWPVLKSGGMGKPIA